MLSYQQLPTRQNPEIDGVVFQPREAGCCHAEQLTCMGQTVDIPGGKQVDMLLAGSNVGRSREPVGLVARPETGGKPSQQKCEKQEGKLGG